MVIAAQITSAAASSSCVSSLLQSSVKQTLKNSVAFLSSGAKLLESPRTSHLSRLPAKLDRSQISVRASSNSPKLTMAATATATKALISESAAWSDLKAHKEAIDQTHLRDLLKDEARCAAMIKEYDGILVDFSRQRATTETLPKLLALAEAFAAERKDGDEKVPSRFRRKKLPKSERRAVAGSGGAKLAGASAHPVDFYDIRGEYSDFESISADVLPLVLVDGYNVVGSWPKLKKPFLRGDTEEARERLLLEVLPYPRYADVRVLVVFDGYNSNSPGNDRILSFGVDVAFSNGISADEWIEKEVSSLMQHRTAPYITVVTSDVQLKLAVLSRGGYVKSSTAFIQELRDARRDPNEALQSTDTYKRSLLEHQLPQETLQGLLAMRRSVAEDDPYYLKYIVKYDKTASGTTLSSPSSSSSSSSSTSSFSSSSSLNNSSSSSPQPSSHSSSSPSPTKHSTRSKKAHGAAQEASPHSLSLREQLQAQLATPQGAEGAGGASSLSAASADVGGISRHSSSNDNKSSEISSSNSSRLSQSSGSGNSSSSSSQRVEGVANGSTSQENGSSHVLARSARDEQMLQHLRKKQQKQKKHKQKHTASQELTDPDKDQQPQNKGQNNEKGMQEQRQRCGKALQQEHVKQGNGAIVGSVSQGFSGALGSSETTRALVALKKQLQEQKRQERGRRR